MSDQAMTREEKLRFERAPCYLCGYNSHDYYQPNVHPCAKLYHMPEDTVESLREELAQVKQERAEALAALLQIQTACGLGRNSQDDLVDVIARMYAKIAELEARRCT